jgi:aldehyde dehydrogenase (NAD+)
MRATLPCIHEENAMSAASDLPQAPATDLDSIPETVARLRRGFESGKTRALAWRRDQLERIERMVREGADELLAAMHADLGKPELEAWLAEIHLVKAEAKLARRKLARWARPRRVATPLVLRPAKSRIVPEPLGVVLIIAPWNYPVQLVLAPLISAIAAGNTVLVKPSEVAAHTSAALARLIARHLDPDAVAVVEGGVAETTALLVERFDHVLYTGNGTVGRIVMEAAARHLTPVTLELGGKSPCLVDASADLEVAARRIAWGKFLNAGQTCIAPDYVLVEASREDALIEALARTLREFYGDDPRRSPDYARIVNVRHLRRLVSLLKDSDVAIGGESDEAERYLAPTVLRHVDPHSAVMSDEIFGPILPVLAVQDMEEALRFVNARPKPLAFYVFTGDARFADRAVAETSSGAVCVNATIWHAGNPHLPFGGVGASGMGAYHGQAGFEAFSHKKPVVTRPARFDPRLLYPPYKRSTTALVKRLPS